jgi:hypothetical protein
MTEFFRALPVPVFCAVVMAVLFCFEGNVIVTKNYNDSDSSGVFTDSGYFHPVLPEVETYKGFIPTHGKATFDLTDVQSWLILHVFVDSSGVRE